jgi:hypothetical protein
MQVQLILSTLAALTISATTVAAAPPAMRRWTDTTGKFSMDATYVQSRGDKVVLKKGDGATLVVPLARLSAADQAYLKTLTTSKLQAPNNGGPRPNLVFPDAVTEPPSWHDRNTPFDLATFLKAPPEDENAAPLYLEALYEFAPLEMMDLLYPGLSQEEQKRRRDVHRPISKEHLRLHEAWENDPQSVDRAAVDAWLANFDVGFEKLAAAQQRPKCMFQPGRSLHSLWPHIQAARAVGRVVTWRSRRDRERGDLERPVRDLEMLLRLNRDFQVGGVAVSQAVAAALDRVCCDLVLGLLNAPSISARQCDRLLALLVEHEAKSVDGFVETNRAEYISSRQALHDLQHRTGSFDPQVMRDDLQIEGDVTSPLACIKLFADLGSFDAPQMQKVATRLQASLLPDAWQGGKMLSEEDYATEVAALNRFYATLFALAAQPGYRRLGERQLQDAVALVNQTMLAALVIPPEAAILELLNRGEARLHGTQCLVALRRWRLDHAGAPPDLDRLVKAAGLPRVPIDPFAGEPLRLAILDGQPVIYSVGSDRKDDKAQITWNEVHKEPGDFIFRLEILPK